MKKLLAVLLLTIATPAAAIADEAPTAVTHTKDARLVPAIRNGEVIGLKVYAIRPGGRFDQSQAPFQAGDTIEQVDGIGVMTAEGTQALFDKVIRGTADTVVTVRRKGDLVQLESKHA